MIVKLAIVGVIIVFALVYGLYQGLKEIIEISEPNSK